MNATDFIQYFLQTTPKPKSLAGLHDSACNELLFLLFAEKQTNPTLFECKATWSEESMPGFSVHRFLFFEIDEQLWTFEGPYSVQSYQEKFFQEHPFNGLMKGCYMVCSQESPHLRERSPTSNEATKRIKDLLQEHPHLTAFCQAFRSKWEQQMMQTSLPHSEKGQEEGKRL